MGKSRKSNLGTDLFRLLVLLLVALALLLAGRPGFSAPPGAYRPPLVTIDNPNPWFSAHFGYSLAGVGDDRILVGVPWDNFAEGVGGGGVGGTAHLFNTNGVVLTTFADPLRKIGDVFGKAVAGLGSGRALVGSPGALTNGGVAYLFNTNGILLTSFTNPSAKPYGQFGAAVAGVGTDRVLVGSPGESTAAVGSGMAYLFDTNGVLLTTFTNPTPAGLDAFGTTVAGVGNDLVVIGALDDTGGRDSGAAYLFTATGALLMTFTNPAPVEAGTFGWTVAGVGSDRLLVSAEQNIVGGLRAGVGYLFATNGALLATFTNPAPAGFNGVGFAHGSAVVGGDKILIGAYGEGAGVCYLFDTNGAHLATFTNPRPGREQGGSFGFVVAALGSDLFLVGADGSNVGAEGAGSIYVYAVPGPPPPLRLSLGSSNVSVGWVAPEPGFILQQAGVLGSPAAWNDVQEPVSSNGPTNLFQQPLDPTNRFYRLRWP